MASVLADTFLQQIFTDAFFHADPHPGNLFVTPGPDAASGEPAWTLTFIDFGMVGHVPDHLRAGLRDLVIAAALRDAARMVAGLSSLDVLLQTFSIMGQSLGRHELAEADVVIRPQLAGVAATDFQGRHLAVLEGERAATAMRPEIRRRLAAGTEISSRR